MAATGWQPTYSLFSPNICSVSIQASLFSGHSTPPCSASAIRKPCKRIHWWERYIFIRTLPRGGIYKPNTSLLSEESSRQCTASLFIKSFININLSLGMYQGIPKESLSVRRFKLAVLKSILPSLQCTGREKWTIIHCRYPQKWRT